MTEISIPQERNLSNQFFSPETVIDVITKTDGVVQNNIHRMVRLYPNYEMKQINNEQLEKLDWYFDKNDSTHISWQLTDSGQHRKVRDVALKYLELKSQNALGSWDGARKIEDISQKLEHGQQLPPIVIIPGERYPDSPDSSFIDGVHRSLGAVVCSLRTGKEVSLDAYVGEKASLFARAIKKFR